MTSFRTNPTLMRIYERLRKRSYRLSARRWFDMNRERLHHAYLDGVRDALIATQEQSFLSKFED